MLLCLVLSCSPAEVQLTKVPSETGGAIKVHTHGVSFLDDLEFSNAPGPWDKIKASRVPILPFPTFHWSRC